MGLRHVTAMAACAIAVASPGHRAGAEDNAWIEAGRAAVVEARHRDLGRRTAKNIILFVGDGMGLSTVTAARILEGQLRGESGEENLLSFERFPHVALTKTYNTNQQTPDSAGTMTALVTGAKTRAGVLSVDEFVNRRDFAGVDGHRLATIVEQAEDRGLSTGIVTTTAVTHATPAALYAHTPERGWQSDGDLPPRAIEADFPDLARQLIEFPHGDGLEVVLGGGEKNFRPIPVDPSAPLRFGVRRDGRDLTEEWVALHPDSFFVRTCSQLHTLEPEKVFRLFGLFAPGHLRFEADRANHAVCEPSLSQMTLTALSILKKNPRGYFLMVEGGRIDHSHHTNNAYRALIGTIEFARAVAIAVEQTNSDDTLIVVTADHGHVFSIGGYPIRGNDILGLVIENDRKGRRKKVPARDGLDRPYTTLGYMNGPGYTGASNQQPEGPKQFPHAANTFHGITQGRPDLSEVNVSRPAYLQESAIPMRSETHSGEDVPVYARGPGSSLFHGVQEQSFVYHAMVEAFGWNRAGR